MADNVVKRVSAIFTVKDDGYNKSLNDMNKQMKLTQSEIKLAGERLKTFGNNTGDLVYKQEALTKQINNVKDKIDIYNKSLVETPKILEENRKKADDLRAAKDALNKRYKEAIKVYGEESEEAKKLAGELEKSKEAYKEKEQVIKSNVNTLNTHLIGLKNTEAELTRLQSELSKTNSELDKNQNKWLKASESMKKASDKLKDIGSKVSGAGDKILKATAPLVAAAGASHKFSVDFEKSMAKVSTISDESEVSLQDLGKQVINLSNETGIASTEIAGNVYEAISAGQKTGDAVNFVTKSTKLAKAGFAEAADSLDILTTILNAYQLKSTEAANVSDILIQVQNKGKVTVGELASVMGKVIPTAVDTNTSLKQLGAGYALMTSRGIKAAESTTYMNSMLNELSKTGTKSDKALRSMTGKTFNELMKEGKSLSDVLNILGQYARRNELSLKDMFGSAEAGKAALVLSTNAGRDFTEMLKDMDKSAGATDAAFEKVTNTRGERLTKSLNKIKNSSIKFGDAIAPLLDKVSALIDKLADKIGSLSEEQVQSIIKWGAAAVAMGGVLKVGGGVISTVGGIAGGLSKLTGALGAAKTATTVASTAATVAGGAGGFGALASGLGAAAVAALPWVAGAAAVAGAGYLIYKGLTQETVPAVDLFADKIEVTAAGVAEAGEYMGQSYETTVTKISESTKEAVGAYVELDNGAKESLNSLYINSTVINEQIKKDTISKYTEMKNKVVAGYEAQKNESIAKLQEMFSLSQSVTASEQQNILQQTTAFYEGKKTQTATYEQQILDILNNASANNRALNAGEAQAITDIQNKMREDAVKALSQNEIEAQIILQRMKDYDGRITAEQAAQHIKALNESRDKAVQAANDEYDKRIALITRMRDEAKSITAEQANKMIEEAKRQRDGIVEKAEDTRLTAIEKMRDLNSTMDKDVDTTTGKILNWWDKLKRWWSGWKPEEKNLNVDSKVSTPKGYSSISENASGTSYFQGGLTTLHEKGYEVYDLPRGTKIYNHEASEDLVRKTAEAVAAGMGNMAQTINHTGVIRVEGVNDQGQLIAVKDIIMEEIRKEVRMAW